jgi:hypothetical protein
MSSSFLSALGIEVPPYRTVSRHVFLVLMSTGFGRKKEGRERATLGKELWKFRIVSY